MGRKLIALARQKQAALMCAEAVPWRCHCSSTARFWLTASRLKNSKRDPYAPAFLNSMGSGQRNASYISTRACRNDVAHGHKGAARRTKVIQLKRVYEKAADDGKRFLIERLWPRGIKKTALHLDAWLKEVGPSTPLRQWFGHDPRRWEEFRRRYFCELDRNAEAWMPILRAANQGRVTLLFSSHDTEHNNAVALKEYLESKQRGKRASRIPVRNAAA